MAKKYYKLALATILAFQYHTLVQPFVQAFLLF